MRQKIGIYCIHRTCAIYQNKAYIFWGGLSGIGKTRDAFELSKENNAIFYFDEKVLLDLNNIKFCGGINKSIKTKNIGKKLIRKLILQKKTRDFLFALWLSQLWRKYQKI